MAPGGRHGRPGPAPGAIAYRVMWPLMAGVARIHFRGLETDGRGHVPAHGAVLVVANHPAAWTDALVLDLALRRGLHFVAHEALFHPWIRGLFLRLFASLPVRSGSEDPRAATLNRATFDRCHSLFRRGAAIVIFPEGVSESDRHLRPLKPGAARLVLEHIATGEPAPPLVPVAIHYDDRTRFRTGVTVVVGAPIPAAGIGAVADLDRAAESLTVEMAAALQALLVLAAARAGEARARAVARPGGRSRSAAGLESALGRLGLWLHAPATAATGWIARRLAGAPQQVSFGRMVSGLVLVPLWYAALVAMALRLGGGAWLAIPAAAPLLGVLACREVDRRHARSAAPRAAGAGGSG